MTKTVILPRKGEFARYETADGAIAYHIEYAPGRYFGLEGITAGVSLAPRTKQEIAAFIERHSLRFVETGRMES